MAFNTHDQKQANKISDNEDNRPKIIYQDKKQINEEIRK